MNVILGSRAMTALLLAVCGVLGTVAADRLGEIGAPGPDATGIALSTTPPARVVAPPTVEPVPALPPLASLSETVDRPLFNETRRPIEIDAPAAPKAEEPTLNVMLTGVVITGDKRIANILSPDEPRVRLLSEGDSIENWRIESILPDRIILSANGRVEHVLLREAAPPKPAKAERAPNPRRPVRSLRRGKPPTRFNRRNVRRPDN